MKMTFKTEVFIYLLHPLKMTSDLFRFVHLGLNEASVDFNLWQYIDCRWLDAFSTPTLTNPGRFAHFPVRLWVVSPTFPFAPCRFAPGSFRPLSRSPLSRFAHFPVRPLIKFYFYY